MLKWWIRRQIRKFESANHYDMGYAYELLDIDPDAMIRLNRLIRLAYYRKEIPVAPWFAAKLVKEMAADCGPCTQLVVGMAERAGVPAAAIRAILAHDEPSMPDDVALAYRFARAVMARSPEANSLRPEVISRWGKKGLVSLAYAIATGGVFPDVKYAMGHGQSCTRVTVAGESVAVHHPQAS
jgi:hypothetical protein